MAAKTTQVKKATKKVGTGNTASKKVAPKKAVAKKAPPKKAAASVAAPEKSAAKKAPPKKAAPQEAAAKPGSPQAVAAHSAPSLIGKKAPAFDLMDQSGRRVSSSGLAGKPYVLYFYPKDNTPGCTKEACDFRDAHGNFSRAKVTVLGVSPDSEKSHANFANKYELPFPLLVDADKTLAQAYGAWALKKNYGREYWGIVRSTFLIGADGKVKKQWRGVRVTGHVDAVLEEARG